MAYAHSHRSEASAMEQINDEIYTVVALAGAYNAHYYYDYVWCQYRNQCSIIDNNDICHVCSLCYSESDWAFNNSPTNNRMHERTK